MPTKKKATRKPKRPAGKQRGRSEVTRTLLAACNSSRSSKRFRPSAVAELMRKHGLSASELGRKIGVSRQTIWAYRERVTEPQFGTVLRMAAVFDKPLDFFVERERQGK